jgi:hypothetical protein
MKTTNTRIGNIIKSSRRYNRRISGISCKYDAQIGAFIYDLWTHRLNQPSRTHHHYRLINLYPEQRERLVKEIGLQPGITIP